MKLGKVCRYCGVELIPGQNWYPSREQRYDCICSECHQAHTKQYHQEHAETVRARKRKYRRRIRSIINAYKAKRYRNRLDVREKVKARARRWIEANRDKKRAQSNRHLVRKYNANGLHTSEEFLYLVGLCEGRCPACGAVFTEEKPPTRDHIIPLSKGGSNDISNIQPLCLSCNSSKLTKSTNYMKGA